MANVLAPFGNTIEISQSLLKMAFMDDSPASSAVLHGVLALSSLKLHGDKEASAFRNRAISMLSASLRDEMDLSEYLRCLGASLLLGSYEISRNADHQVDWTFFVCGAIKIAKALSLPQRLDSEENMLLNWLSCHTGLSLFSQCHWLQYDSCVARHPCTEDARLNSVYSLIPDRSIIIGFLGCSLEFLDILSSICFVVHPRNHPNFLSERHKREIYSLELRLRSIQQQKNFDAPEPHDIQCGTEQVAELYRLAGLLYLHRAALKAQSDFQPTKVIVEKAFDIINCLGHCEAPWPLFVVGCEAKTDSRRLKIMEIVAKTQKKRDSRNMRSVKQMIKAFWVQDDLCEDEEIDYSSRISALISAYTILPTFV